MCRIFVHGYHHCDCIYTRAEIIACVDFLGNENVTCNPKHLTFTRKNLDREIDGTDYLSSDKVDLSRPYVPKNFACRNVEVRHEELQECCPLCGNARVVRELGKMGVEWDVERGEGVAVAVAAGGSSYGSRGIRDMESYEGERHDAKGGLERCWERWCGE
ncbi:hypothetical protein N7G274_009783 [Stereocaulon virgatum]|uniref:Uncharacterized protein n=1 Tax=Stereocaulon virgatum TaxID=373712 RepID=A0ABR3ZZJ0_9LECA